MTLTRRTEPASGTLQRSSGLVRLDVAQRDGRTRLARVRQQGSLKVLFPRAGDAFEAVLVNTSGGVVAGDRLAIDIRAAAGTGTILTTQAAERCYRTRAPAERAHLATAIDIAPNATVEWLPMETILFDGAALDRRLRIDLAPGSTFLAVESRILGRTAHGERCRTLDLRDHLTIRRDTVPILIDSVRLDNEGEPALARAATAGGALATATIVLVAADAHDRLERIRPALEGDAGASAWNGMLVIRLLSHDAQRHRRQIVRLLAILRDGRPLPTVWRC